MPRTSRCHQRRSLGAEQLRMAHFATSHDPAQHIAAASFFFFSGNTPSEIPERTDGPQ